MKPIAHRDTLTLNAYARCLRVGRMPGRKAFERRGIDDAYGLHASIAAIRRAAYISTLRYAFIERFGFAVLCHEVVEALRPLSPLIEVGAGTGSWAFALRNAGLDVIASDPGIDYQNAFKHGAFLPLLELRGDAAVTMHADRNVLCVWPSYDDEWATNAARAMAPGRTLALVGEGEGGCTGSDSLFELLDDKFLQVGGCHLPQWPGLHDRLSLHLKLT